MVSTKAVLLSCVIDAQEHQYVATIYIPNALIQNRVKNIEDVTTTIVQESLFDVMIEIAPDIYRPCVSTDKKGVKNQILI